MDGDRLCLLPEFSPKSISCIASFFALFVLLMDLFDMIGLFIDRGLQPQLSFFCGCMTPGAVCACFCVVVPWRVRNKRTTFDPIHVVIWCGDKIHFVHRAFHPAQVRAKMK